MISKMNELNETFDEVPLRKQWDVYLNVTGGVKHGLALGGLKTEDVYGSTSSKPCNKEKCIQHEEVLLSTS